MHMTYHYIRISTCFNNIILTVVKVIHFKLYVVNLFKTVVIFKYLSVYLTIKYMHTQLYYYKAKILIKTITNIMNGHLILH